MDPRPLGRSGLRIAPLVFGANVFGWTVDQATAYELLDRFVDSGLNAIDTADVYSRWVLGNKGGESETMIGNWLKRSPARRQQIALITKVGAAPGPDGRGLSAQSIAAGVEASLRRLHTDRIDLYLSHRPDAGTPIEETLRAYEALIRAGKVRAIGSSNSTAAGLREALETATAQSRYEVEQPEYNLCERGSFEGPLRDLCISEDLGVIVYYSLASGFLSGKYRSQADLTNRARGEAPRPAHPGGARCRGFRARSEARRSGARLAHRPRRRYRSHRERHHRRAGRQPRSRNAAQAVGGRAPNADVYLLSGTPSWRAMGLRRGSCKTSRMKAGGAGLAKCQLKPEWRASSMSAGLP